jgi:hypothetical protein
MADSASTKAVISLAPMSPDPYFACHPVQIPTIQPVQNKDCTWNRTSLMKCTSCTPKRLAASSSASVCPLRRSSTMPRNFPFSRRALPGLLRSFLTSPRCSCLHARDEAPPSVPALFRHSRQTAIKPFQAPNNLHEKACVLGQAAALPPGMTQAGHRCTEVHGELPHHWEVLKGGYPTCAHAALCSRCVCSP